MQARLCQSASILVDDQIMTEPRGQTTNSSPSSSLRKVETRTLAAGSLMTPSRSISLSTKTWAPSLVHLSSSHQGAWSVPVVTCIDQAVIAHGIPMLWNSNWRCVGAALVSSRFQWWHLRQFRPQSIIFNSTITWLDGCH